MNQFSAAHPAQYDSEVGCEWALCGSCSVSCSGGSGEEIPLSSDTEGAQGGQGRSSLLRYPASASALPLLLPFPSHTAALPLLISPCTINHYLHSEEKTDRTNLFPQILIRKAEARGRVIRFLWRRERPGQGIFPPLEKVTLRLLRSNFSFLLKLVNSH